MAKKVVYIHLGLSPNIIWHHDGAWVGVVSFQHPMHTLWWLNQIFFMDSGQHTLCINVVLSRSFVRFILRLQVPRHPRPHTLILHIPHVPRGSRHFEDFPDGSDNMFLLPRSLALEMQPTG